MWGCCFCKYSTASSENGRLCDEYLTRKALKFSEHSRFHALSDGICSKLQNVKLISKDAEG